ncbi:hypothetical protein OH76DRAFT_459063 [Lentinus brumalis]|uniref:Uncharacterized protein n=1 Tax=Lentinus brumalis TaxID=2498619 RepID=A0A371DDN9_9APHY|nr:hypothetical protein OH76DRAFT_459063 [Polyporus brumalis]
MVPNLRQASTRSIALMLMLPITSVAPRAIHSFVEEGPSGATGPATGDTSPGTQRGCEPACAPSESNTDLHYPPTTNDNALPVGAASRIPSHSTGVRRAMEQLSDMAQYFLTEYSPDHADVNFAFALPDGDCIAQLSYISENGGQAIHISLILQDDDASVSDSGPALVVGSPGTREVTAYPGTTMNALSSLGVTSASLTSVPLTGAIELTSISQPTTVSQSHVALAGRMVLTSPACIDASSRRPRLCAASFASTSRRWRSPSALDTAGTRCCSPECRGHRDSRASSHALSSRQSPARRHTTLFRSR